jgi:hypothetical protein
MANERYLMRRVLDGLSGWLTYVQASGAKTLYCEHFLYPPIHDIVKGRDWSVAAQQPLKGNLKKRIDFVFYRRAPEYDPPGLVLLEVKYLTNVNRTIELERLSEDFDKLRDISGRTLRDDMSDCGPPTKFVLVVGQHSDLTTIANSASRKFQDVIDLLAMSIKDKPPSGIYRSVVETKLKSELHWNAIAFGEKRWPAREQP